MLKGIVVSSRTASREPSNTSSRDEDIAKLGCKPSSLARMARKARAVVRDYPSSPTSLEDLVIPPHYLQTSIDEPLLLWDSGFSTAKRRSLLFGTPANVAVLQDADHLVIDGAFKSAPSLFAWNPWSL